MTVTDINENDDRTVLELELERFTVLKHHWNCINIIDLMASKLTIHFFICVLLCKLISPMLHWGNKDSRRHSCQFFSPSTILMSFSPHPTLLYRSINAGMMPNTIGFWYPNRSWYEFINPTGQRALLAIIDSNHLHFWNIEVGDWTRDLWRRKQLIYCAAAGANILPSVWYSDNLSIPSDTPSSQKSWPNEWFLLSGQTISEKLLRRLQTLCYAVVDKLIDQSIIAGWAN